MYIFSVAYRVCYADTDQMGYMYYGNYARLYEIARVESLRNLGLSYKSLEETGIAMPVYENYSKFHSPALYDDLLRIDCFIDSLPTARIVFNYKIYNQNELLIHEGKTTLVFMKLIEKKLVKVPDEILLALKSAFR
jgi:acyl-CoA thioester hydrolase